MKKTVAVLAALATAAMANAAVIEQVIVRQQWPWSTDIKVEYRLADVTNPVDIAVQAYNGNEQLDGTRLASSIRGDVYGISKDGVGQFIIDPVAAFGTSEVALANFRVKLTVSESAANINEVLYKIFDLTSGACTDVTRADLLNGKYGTCETSCVALGIENSTVTDVLVWTGVTNNPAYKTDKLVLRKVPAKGQTFQMGTPDGHVDSWRATAANETAHNVTLTNDFWAGVFEVTRKQFRNILGWGTSDPAATAASGASYNTVRGTDYSWPQDMYNVSSSSFMGILRQRTGNVLLFDLPTEAQWEYACQAGTEPYYANNGSNLCTSGTEGLGAVAWFNTNSENAVHEVGQKSPNAWGLYDMQGNVVEWCLDWKFSGTRPADAVTDPMGEGSGTKRICRGGYYSAANNSCRTQWVGEYTPDTGSTVTGFRVFCRIPNGD